MSARHGVAVALFVVAAVFARAQDTPENPGERHQQYGISLLAVGSFEDAEQEFLKAREYLPRDGRLVFYLAYVHYFQGRYDQALAELSVSEELGYRSSWVHRTATEIHMVRGDFSDAVLSLQETHRVHAEELSQSVNSPSWRVLIYEDMLKTYSTEERLYTGLGSTDRAAEAVRLGHETSRLMEFARQERRAEDTSDDSLLGAIRPLHSGDFRLASSRFDALPYIGIGYRGPDLVPWIARMESTRNSSPTRVLKAAAVIFRTLEIDQRNADGNIHGSNIRTTRQATDGQIGYAIAQAETLALLVRALSDGRVRLEVQEYVVAEPVTELNPSGHADFSGNREVHDLLVELHETVDLLFVVSDHFASIDYATMTDVETEWGRFERLAMAYVGIDHNFLYWNHEFFHVVEMLFDISPYHGFQANVREAFPQWRGETDDELDYYNWHWLNSIAPAQ